MSTEPVSTESQGTPSLDNEPVTSAEVEPSSRRRWKKPLGWTIGLLLFLLLVVVGIGFWLLTTSGGANWTLERVLRELPEGSQVEFDQLQGSLLSGLQLDGFRYRDPEGMLVTIDQLQAHAALPPLRDNLIIIHHLRARGVTVELPPSDEPDEPFDPPDIELPFDVVLQEGVVDGFVVRTPNGADGEPLFELDHLRTQAQLAGTPAANSLTSPVAGQPPGQLTLEQLEVAAPAWRFEGQGEMRLSGDYPLDITIDALEQIVPANQPKANQPKSRLEGRLHGDLARLDLEAELLPDVDSANPAQLRVRLDEPFGQRLLDGTVTFDRLDPRTRFPAVPAHAVAGEISFAGPLDRLQMQVDLDAESVQYGQWQLKGSASVPPKPTEAGAEPTLLQVDQMYLRRLDGPGELTIDASLDARGIQVTSVEGEFLRGQVRGEGRLDWQPELTWDFDLQARQLQPQQMWPDLAAEWPGRLDLDAAAIGRRDPSTEDLEGTVIIRQMDGVLRGSPLQGQGEIGFGLHPSETLPELEVKELVLSWGQTELQAHGKLGLQAERQEWDLEWQLSAPDLAHLQSLLPPTLVAQLFGPEAVEAPATAGLRGSLSSQGKLLGAIDRPGIAATFQLDQLALAERSIAHAEGDIRLELRADSPLELELRAEKVRAPELYSVAALEPPTGATITARSTPVDDTAVEDTAVDDSAVDDSALDDSALTPSTGEPEDAMASALTSEGIEPIVVQSQIREGEYGEFELVELTADGTLDEHHLDLRLETSELRGGRWLEIALAGGADPPPTAPPSASLSQQFPDLAQMSWRGVIEKLRVHEPAVGTWSSLGDTQLRLGEGRWRLDELCLRPQSEDASVCAAVSRLASGNLVMEGRLEQLPTTLFSALMPPELSLGGRLDGNLLLRYRPPSPTASTDGEQQASASDPPIDTPVPVDVLASISGPPDPTKPDPTDPEPAIPEPDVPEPSRADALTGGLELTLSPGELRLPSEPGLPDLRQHRGGRVSATLRNGVVRGEGRLDLDTMGFIESEVELPLPVPGAPANGASGPMRVQVETELRDLRFLDALTDTLDDVQGVLTADMTWERAASSGDQVAAARLRGSARLREAKAKLPALGIRLNDIELDAQAEGGARMSVQGKATSGGGEVRVQGTAFPPLPGAVPSTAASPQAGEGSDNSLLADLQITGTDFLAQRSPELTLYISPNLDVRVGRERIDVDGRVIVPRAIIDLEAGRAAVPVSSDVVYVNTRPQVVANQEEVPIYSRLEVILGDDIELRSANLNLHPTGRLSVVDQPGRATTAIGELILETGTFTLYGNTLVLDGGTIVYTGNPITNPGLRLKAYRETQDPEIRAGVLVTGTVARPEIEIFTEPPNSPSDSLAYLVTGRPLAQSTGTADSDMLVQAAAKVGLRRGNLLLERLGDKLGLQEAKIESRGDLAETSLFLGKQLTDRLYVVYRVGLVEPISTLQIRYRLNEKWSLRGQTGDGSGGDLLYSVR